MTEGLIPEKAFELLTPETVTPAVLYLVSEDARRLRLELGQADRHRLDQYLESVRSLEKRLERAESPTTRPWKSKVDFLKRETPADAPKEHAERVRLMLDMANRLEFPLILSSMHAQALASQVAKGHGEWDNAAIIAFYNDLVNN